MPRAIISQGSYDAKTPDIEGTGEFIGGTGKCAGITGSYTCAGFTLKAEARGSHELKR